jgi:excisionase family DNA binding protein
MSETAHDPLELLTVERVAGLLCCSERYVYNQVKAGRLVGTRLGRSVKISRQNLQSFLAGCETGAEVAAQPDQVASSARITVGRG